VRRVPDRNLAHQSELFTVYRYHAVFTNSPLPTIAAESAHRAHAEEVIADLTNGPLAHLPPGHFWANSVWLVCAAMAFHLTRAAGALASLFHAKATTGTMRTHLINGSRPANAGGQPRSLKEIGSGRRNFSESSMVHRLPMRSRPTSLTCTPGLVETDHVRRCDACTLSRNWLGARSGRLVRVPVASTWPRGPLTAETQLSSRPIPRRLE